MVQFHFGYNLPYISWFEGMTLAFFDVLDGANLQPLHDESEL